mgnify:CR=1 FL=1
MLVLVTLVVSLKETQGHLVYSLDDPYIHLALAESILEGEYGINSGEYASPSSSILYPFLMAFGLFLGFGSVTPLLFTIPSSLLSVWVVAGVANRQMEFEKFDNMRWPFIVLAAAIALSMNAVALPFTGMEHSVHVLAVVLALSGLYRTAVLKDTSGLGVAVVGTIICAFIRFEGLALALAMIIALGVLGYRRHAIFSALVIVAGLAMYFATMKSYGLPALPSSVMTKSIIAADAADADAFGLIVGFLVNIYVSLFNRWGTLFALTATALCVVAFLGKDFAKGHRVFLTVVAATLSAHVVAGQYGWFARYEVYAVAAMLFGWLALLKITPATSLKTQAAALLLLVAGSPYLHPTLTTSAASANIFQQQYQMGRFAKDFFPARVAVNDLGYVAYGNSNYVLDLWGLGSEEARRLSRSNQWTPELLDEITKRHDIRYAMIYDAWFRDVPAEWCLVGRLVTSKVTSASDNVSFYLIQRDQDVAMRAALNAFIVDLPEGAKMATFECETS